MPAFLTPGATPGAWQHWLSLGAGILGALVAMAALWMPGQSSDNEPNEESRVTAYYVLWLITLAAVPAAIWERVAHPFSALAIGLFYGAVALLYIAFYVVSVVYVEERLHTDGTPYRLGACAAACAPRR